MQNIISFEQFLRPHKGEKFEALFFPSESSPEISPTIVYIHGYNTFGAWDMIYPARVLTNFGYNIILPSQRGFGYSNGPRDYYGPKTISGIADVVQEVIQKKNLNQKKIAVHGVSRGASVAALLAVHYPKLWKAAVFQSGAYDLQKNYQWEKKHPMIKKQIEDETGLSEEAMRDRSPIFDMKTLACPVLILHGEDDENVPAFLSRELAEELTRLRKPYSFHILPKKGHKMSGPELRKKHILPFFRENLN
ncbi:MAG TPA: alpha/beta fold hydrolase [Candidatus Paceibacterota bacterium]|nr:alpha/beta fold hydrolase [Candidatus Paceibacterota bacterium]